jgi:hypothetical protein
MSGSAESNDDNLAVGVIAVLGFALLMAVAAWWMVRRRDVDDGTPPPPTNARGLPGQDLI